MPNAILLMGLLALAAFVPEPSEAQNFTCSSGRPACLDYGDKVCPSNGKCIDTSAICFDESTCDYKGFTCKSNADECVDDYNELLQEHGALTEENEEVTSHYEDLKSCVELSETLEEARNCVLESF